MLKTKVIASSISNLTDARYFAAWECSWLGFPLTGEGKDLIKPEEVVAFKEWVDGVKFIGEFSGSTGEEIVHGAKILALDAVQVDDLTGVDVLMHLEELIVFKEIEIDEETDIDFLQNLLEQFAPYCENFILKPKGDVQQIVEKIHEFSLQFPEQTFWLDSNIQPAQLDEIIESPFAGIILRGGAEEKVGLKSFDELDEVFEALEVEE